MSWIFMIFTQLLFLKHFVAIHVGCIWHDYMAHILFLKLLNQFPLHLCKTYALAACLVLQLLVFHFIIFPLFINNGTWFSIYIYNISFVCHLVYFCRKPCGAGTGLGQSST